jgi:hypothetical protein
MQQAGRHPNSNQLLHHARLGTISIRQQQPPPQQQQQQQQQQ